MTRFLIPALVALTVAAAPSAQDADALVGTWTVARLVDTSLERDTSDVLSLVFPSHSFTLAPTRVVFAPDGGARLWLFVTRSDGYEIAEQPARYRVADGQLTVTFGNHDLSFALRAEDEAWMVADETATYRLVRD